MIPVPKKGLQIDVKLCSNLILVATLQRLWSQPFRSTGNVIENQAEGNDSYPQNDQIKNQSRVCYSRKFEDWRQNSYTTGDGPHLVANS